MANTGTNTVEKHDLRITGDSKSVAEACRKLNAHDDLLAACKAALGFAQMDDAMASQLEAAIAKATEPTP